METARQRGQDSRVRGFYWNVVNMKCMPNMRLSQWVLSGMIKPEPWRQCLQTSLFRRVCMKTLTIRVTPMSLAWIHYGMHVLLACMFFIKNMHASRTMFFMCGKNMHEEHACIGFFRALWLLSCVCVCVLVCVSPCGTGMDGWSLSLRLLWLTPASPDPEQD